MLLRRCSETCPFGTAGHVAPVRRTRPPPSPSVRRPTLTATDATVSALVTGTAVRVTARRRVVA